MDATGPNHPAMDVRTPRNQSNLPLVEKPATTAGNKKCLSTNDGTTKNATRANTQHGTWTKQMERKIKNIRRHRQSNGTTMDKHQTTGTNLKKTNQYHRGKSKSGSEKIDFQPAAHQRRQDSPEQPGL
jgi:hypothetical protein